MEPFRSTSQADNDEEILRFKPQIFRSSLRQSIACAEKYKFATSALTVPASLFSCAMHQTGCDITKGS